MADLVLKESFVCCCDLKFLRNSIVFPLGLKSDKTEKTRKRMVSFQVIMVKAETKMILEKYVYVSKKLKPMKQSVDADTHAPCSGGICV